jgi:hypothetical protein
MLQRKLQQIEHNVDIIWIERINHASLDEMVFAKELDKKRIENSNNDWCYHIEHILLSKLHRNIEKR